MLSSLLSCGGVVLLNNDVYRPTKIFRGLIPDEQAFRQHDSADSEDSENSDGSDDSDGSDMEPLLTALFPH